MNVFDSSAFSNWRIVVMFAIIAFVLLLANMIRRRVKLFKKLLFPTAIIAGFIGLGLKELVFALFLKDPIMQNDVSNFLNSITYHTIALGFIAMGLKTVKKNEDGAVKGKPIKSGLLIVNTYIIQGILGILITVGLFYVFNFTEVFPHVGLLIPMAFGQGPGQVGNIGGIFGSHGFLGGEAGGRSYGLTIATLGTLWACIGGIFYINKRQKDGVLTRVKEEEGQLVRTEDIESIGEIPVSEAIDKMSMQIILVLVVYGISYLFMFGITKIVPEMFVGLIWGFNFIFGMIFAMLAKLLHNKLHQKKIIRRKYTNEYMLDRITGVVFDFMIVTSIISIDIESIGNNTGIIVLLVLIGLTGGFLTYFYLKYVIKRLYPNYEHEAYAVFFGTLTGTASNGIALLREIDPNFETPAADDLVSGSASAVLFGAPLLIITGIIHQGGWYLWGSLAVLIFFFVVFSYFLMKEPKTDEATK